MHVCVHVCGCVCARGHVCGCVYVCVLLYDVIVTRHSMDIRITSGNSLMER